MTNNGGLIGSIVDSGKMLTGSLSFLYIDDWTYSADVTVIITFQFIFYLSPTNIAEAATHHQGVTRDFLVENEADQLLSLQEDLPTLATMVSSAENIPRLASSLEKALRKISDIQVSCEEFLKKVNF